MRKSSEANVKNGIWTVAECVQCLGSVATVQKYFVMFLLFFDAIRGVTAGGEEHNRRHVAPRFAVMTKK